MQHWFVYYKLDAAAAREVRPRLQRMQAEIAAAGVPARLMRRADADAATTLLEIYEGIAEPEHFARMLADAVARAGLPNSLIVQRRTERFEALP